MNACLRRLSLCFSQQLSNYSTQIHRNLLIFLSNSLASRSSRAKLQISFLADSSDLLKILSLSTEPCIASMYTKALRDEFCHHVEALMHELNACSKCCLFADELNIVRSQGLLLILPRPFYLATPTYSHKANFVLYAMQWLSLLFGSVIFDCYKTPWSRVQENVSGPSCFAWPCRMYYMLASFWLAELPDSCWHLSVIEQLSS